MSIANLDLMSLDEAAEYLGMTPATLLYKRHRNEGPESHKLAGRVVYVKAEIDDFIRAELTRTARGGV